MSKTTIICEVSEVTFQVVSCTWLYAMAYTGSCVRAMYIAMHMSKNVGIFRAHTMYTTTYKAMYMGMYVMLYMYAKCGRLVNDIGHKSRQFSHLDAIILAPVHSKRNLANGSRNLAKMRGYKSGLRRNLAIDLLKSLGILHFARLARLHSTILTYREINVHVLYMYILLYSGGKKITSQTSLTSQVDKKSTFLAVFNAIWCEVNSKTSICVTSLTSQPVTGG